MCLFAPFFPTTTILMHFYSNDGTGPTTPSSTNASLPTPPALRASQVYLANEVYVYQLYHRLVIADRCLNSMSSSWFPLPPNAPLLKDSDSFTDGTGHSTFDFVLSSNNPEVDPSSVYPLIYHPNPADHSVQVIEQDDDGSLALSNPQPKQLHTPIPSPWISYPTTTERSLSGLG